MGMGVLPLRTWDKSEWILDSSCGLSSAGLEGDEAEEDDAGDEAGAGAEDGLADGLDMAVGGSSLPKGREGGQGQEI